MEDSRAIRDHLRRLLAATAGVTSVTPAASLDDARKLLARRVFDMWVLDFQLGDGTALELLRDAPRPERSASVIVVTSHASSYIRQRCLDEGADAFLDKWEAVARLPAVLERLRPRGGDPGRDLHSD